MRRVVLLGLSVLLLGCGPGRDIIADGESGSSSTSSTSTTDDSETESDSSDTQTDATTDETETETETETGGEDCVPGERDCECLPDGTCLLDDSGHALGCSSQMLCQSCGFEASATSPACRADECPSDCLIDFVELGFAGPLNPTSIPYTTVELAGEYVAYLGAECTGEDGWAWIVPAEQIGLCGSYCEGWMNPGEGITYDLRFYCPPGEGG